MSEGYGTVNRAYGGIPMPVNPFGCWVHAYCEAEAGWSDTISFYQPLMGTGSGLADAASLPAPHTVVAAGRTVHPLCTGTLFARCLPTRAVVSIGAPPQTTSSSWQAFAKATPVELGEFGGSPHFPGFCIGIG